MEICQGTKPHRQPPHVKPNPLTRGGERPTRQSSLNSQAAGPSPRRQTGRTVPAPGLLPVAEPEKGPSMELEATPALHRPSPAVSEPASPPSAVAELEHMLPSSPCVPGAELQSAGPSAFPGIFTPALTIDIEPTVTPDGSCCVTPKNQLGEEKPDLLDFPSRLVTEQLTYMDTELFKKLLPHQCLDSVWSKRNKPGNEHLAPTVRATVAQFNGVAKCVITTCLGNPSMTARDGHGGGALDQGGQGLSNPAELLLPECHRLGSADCLNIPPQEDMGESFHVRRSLCMDGPGWMRDLPEACPLPPQPAWTSWEAAIPDYRTWAGRSNHLINLPPW